MTVRELADLVEASLAAIEATKPADRRDSWAWRAWYEQLRGFIEELVRNHGATCSRRSYEHVLRLADVQATSSIGELQLLRNWVANARKVAP